MSENLSAYERALSPQQLAAHMEELARRQWRITKSANAPYDQHQAMEQLLRDRPELYLHYRQTVQHAGRHDHEPAARPMLQHPLPGDEAREDLEALAKSYLSNGMVPNYADGLALAIRTRPDLYTAFTRRGARETERDSPGRADGGRALATLEALAHDHVAKGMVESYSAGLERAIRERPDLYDAHRRGVQRDSRSRRNEVSVQKVVR